VDPCADNVTAAFRKAIAAAVTDATNTSYSEDDIKEFEIEGCTGGGSGPENLLMDRMTVSYSLYVQDQNAALILKNSVESTDGAAAYLAAFTSQLQQSGVPVIDVKIESIKIFREKEPETLDIAVRVSRRACVLAIALLPFWVQ